MNKKSRIIEVFLQQVESKISGLENELQSLTESKEGEQKSSAGDKFETGREMMRQQEALIEKQLSQLREQRQHLKSAASLDTQSVAFGAMMVVTTGTFLFAGAMGTEEVDGQTVYAISMQSPLGAAFSGKRAGEVVDWRGQQVEVKEVC